MKYINAVRYGVHYLWTWDKVRRRPTRRRRGPRRPLCSKQRCHDESLCKNEKVKQSEMRACHVLVQMWHVPRANNIHGLAKERPGPYTPSKKAGEKYRLVCSAYHLQHSPMTVMSRELLRANNFIMQLEFIGSTKQLTCTCDEGDWWP